MDNPPQSLKPAKARRKGRPGPRLRPATFDDYVQINQLAARFGLRSNTYREWSRLWSANPVYQEVRDRWPIGWVLEDQHGRIVAAVGNIPVSYLLEGRTLRAAASHAWVAEPDYRSAAIVLLDCLINQQDVDFFVTTTNSAASTQAVAALTEPVPLGDWQTLSFRVAGYRRFARKALAVKGVPAAGLLSLPVSGALRVWDRLTAPSLSTARGDVTTAIVNDFDERFGAFWVELVRQNHHVLLAVRDVPTLRWHYTALRRYGELRIVTASRRGLLRGYCVLRAHQHPGYGISGLRLLDYQSIDQEVDVLPALLDEAMRCCRAEGIDVLEHLGDGIPRLRVFDEFARHRARKEFCPYFYQVPDPGLRAQLARPAVWDPSEYEGDASLI
jgi:hypothetical protein